MESERHIFGGEETEKLVIDSVNKDVIELR